MGSFGWSLALEGNSEAIRDTLVETISLVWRDWLPKEAGALAWLGDLIQIEVQPGRASFWLNDQVEWQKAEADHWLKLALAIGRRRLELKGIHTGADFPTVDDAFTDDDHCALCKKVSARLGLQRGGGDFGWSAVREAAWWYGETGRIVRVHRFANDARLVVHADDIGQQDSWTLRAASSDSPFVTVPTRGHFVYAIALGENALALGHRSDDGILVSISEDAGASWQTQASAIAADSRFFSGSRLYAVHQSTLRASDDGGRTWQMLCERMQTKTGDLTPDRFAEGEGRLWAAFYEQLAFSDDGGRTWTARELPIDLCVMSIVPGRSRDVVGIFGERADDDESSVAALRSVDGGAHWSDLGGAPGDDHITAFALRSGLWLWSTLDENTRISSDDGATWKPFGAGADCACEEAPGTLLVGSGGELLRVTQLRE